MDEAADLAEKFVDGLLSQLETDLAEDIRRADVLMENEGITATGTYAAAKEITATYTTPLAKRFLDLLQSVDSLITRIDALWLSGTVDTRNAKDRSYQWQRRLFKTCNRIREHAQGGRTAMFRELERRGRRPRPVDDDDTPDAGDARADVLDAMIDASGTEPPDKASGAEDPKDAATTTSPTTNGSGAPQDAPAEPRPSAAAAAAAGESA